MVKWPTLLLELLVLVVLGAAVWGGVHYPHTQPAPSAPAPAQYVPPSNQIENNRAAPTEAPSPPREIASPTVRHRMPRTRRPAGRPYWAAPAPLRPPLDLRSRAQRRGSLAFCKQVPAIAYQIDRETLINAMTARGLDAAAQAKVLACVGK